jgi:hypothetical protein
MGCELIRVLPQRPAGEGGIPLPGTASSLIDGGHEYAIGGNPHYQKPVIIRSAAIEIETASLDGDDAVASQPVERRLIAAVEANDVTWRVAARAIQVLIDTEAVNLGVPLCQHEHAVIRVAAAVEVIAASVHVDYY